MGTSIYPRLVIGIPVSLSDFFIETNDGLVCKMCKKQYGSSKDDIVFCSKCGSKVAPKKIKEYTESWKKFVGFEEELGDDDWYDFKEEWLHPYSNACSGEYDGDFVFGIALKTEHNAYYCDSDNIVEVNEKSFADCLKKVKDAAAKLGIVGTDVVIFPSVLICC